jgi:GPH family glycoside/pentoside/hexuronide:cation symporter
MAPQPAKPKSSKRVSSKTAKKDKIPIHEKSLYGLGSPSMSITNNMVDAQIQQVLVYGLGMNPAMKSTIVMIFRLWDAFIDPLMGWVSDNTRSRWGRRRPYLVLGCVLMAIFMPFVWRFSEQWDMTWIAVWFTVGGILLSTATTIYNIPYQSLKMEMTPDYHERTSVNVYSGIVIKVFGMILPWIWTFTQLPFFTGQAPGDAPNSLLGIRNLSLWVAGIIILLGIIPALVCKERYYVKAAVQKKEPFWRSFKLTFKSKPFMMMLLFILLLQIEGLFWGMGGYISTYYVWGGDLSKAAVYTGVAGTSSMILGLCSLPLFGYLSRRFGKERSLFLVVLGQILMACSILFVYNPNYPWLMVIPWAFNGLLSAGLWTIVPAMKADVVDDDEVHTGERREGSFESVFSWFQKMAGTLFLGLSGFLVVLVGFDIELRTEQEPGVFRNMILMMSAIPFLLSMVEAYIIYHWPLTENRMREIRNTLEDRRGAVN